MTEFYPIFLNMTGRRCVVIGGGRVAGRKVEALINVGAEVTVISPRLTRSLRSWVGEGKLVHLRREFRPGDLKGFEIAFVATNNVEVNSTIAREGKNRRVWVNAADDPAHCDFILPSILRRGDLVVAVATGGTSPALSRAIREELESYFTEDYTQLAQVVSGVRRELKQRSINPSAEAWRKALDHKLNLLIMEGNQEKAKNYLFERLTKQGDKKVIIKSAPKIPEAKRIRKQRTEILKNHVGVRRSKVKAGKDIFQSSVKA